MRSRTSTTYRTSMRTSTSPTRRCSASRGSSATMPLRGHPPRETKRRPILSPPAQARVDTDIEAQQPGGAARPRLRVLGVDPGSQATGYGVIDRVGSELCWVAHGVLRPPRSPSLSARLAALMQQLAVVIAQYAPDVAS